MHYYLLHNYGLGIAKLQRIFLLLSIDAEHTETITNLTSLFWADTLLLHQLIGSLALTKSLTQQVEMAEYSAS